MNFSSAEEQNEGGGPVGHSELGPRLLSVDLASQDPAPADENHTAWPVPGILSKAIPLCLRCSGFLNIKAMALLCSVNVREHAGGKLCFPTSSFSHIH